ncbi:hypothetical protein [Acrocarpospora sp. B8E8]|uniref:hypothetical protein n=1 Tax=Acrocarpospora sp. B8E8 TaxID=3153572 RepID=UPI00325E94BA
MSTFLSAVNDLAGQARSFTGSLEIPWIDADRETKTFVDFWFAKSQQEELRKLVKVLRSVDDNVLRNALFIAMSRLIVTKGKGASLGRDVSHSRPHRVGLTNDFRVIDKFIESGKRMSRLFSSISGSAVAQVFRSDARATGLRDGSIDLIITSPPYLNAIDYLRGHKLSLVWLGYSISDVRAIRSVSVGAEKGIDAPSSDPLGLLRDAVECYWHLTSRYQRMVDRYLLDLISMYAEQGRILKPGGRSITVIGNSALRGYFLRNDEAVIIAAELSGLVLEDRYERDLPANRRYLPPPTENRTAQLGKRMRTESVLKFRRRAMPG